MRLLTIAAVCSMLLVLLMPQAAVAHGDARMVDEVLTLGPEESATFAAELHYHRLVGHVSSTGLVRVSLRHTVSGGEVVARAPGVEHSFNELVRCCDEARAPHELIIENLDGQPVTVTARAGLVHDDLAVMVDGAESGTRMAIFMLGLGWWAMARRAVRRGPVPLRLPAMGLAVLALFLLAVGGYAFLRYGVGGAPAVVAGTGDLPVLPMNPIVSRASLLMGFSMVGWALVAGWWLRARPDRNRRNWMLLGSAIVGAAAVVGVAVTQAYGGPLIQLGWMLAVGVPIGAVVTGLSRREARASIPTG